ncbi:MAG TPA: T9SS type A sorting domain-containing protein [Chitinophagaceae bacterium]|nr:T9SS type A sorting domain-containing protein [Chitinophagaceae bacterium]
MKKLYLTVTAVLFSLLSFAQVRTIKLEVTLTTPASGATIMKGTSFEQKFVIKNLGPAAIKATDTIGFVDPATPSGSYTFRVGYVKGVGDTMQINRTGYSFPASTASGSTNYCVLAFAQNRKDTINFDTTGGTFQDCNTIMITPPTGIAELFTASAAGQQLGISPNPASAAVEVDFTATSNSMIVARVYDLTGRVVLSKDYDKPAIGEKGFKLDIAALDNGTYFIEIRQDEYKAVGKLLKQ